MSLAHYILVSYPDPGTRLYLDPGTRLAIYAHYILVSYPDPGMRLYPDPGTRLAIYAHYILVSYPDPGMRLAIYAKSPVAFAFSVVLSLQVHPRAIKLFNHDATYMRKNTRLSPLVQLQCSHSGAEKPGNEARISV